MESFATKMIDQIRFEVSAIVLPTNPFQHIRNQQNEKNQQNQSALL